MKNNYLWALLAFAGAGAATYFIVRTTTKDKREEKARKRADLMLKENKNGESAVESANDKPNKGGFLSNIFSGLGDVLDFAKGQAELEGYQRYITNTTASSLNIREKASSTSPIVGTLKKGEYFYGKPSGLFIEVFSVNISKAEPEYTSRGFVSASFAKKA